MALEWLSLAKTPSAGPWLIFQFGSAHNLVSCRRIQAELALLGHEVAELTIARYMHRPSPHVARLAHRARPRARRYHRYQRVT